MYESVFLRSDGMMPRMAEYLERHRIIFESPPTEGFEGIPLGNGSLTAMAWHTARSLEMHLNHSDAFDLAQAEVFRSWSWEGEERQCAQVSAGHLTIEEGMPDFDRNYLAGYRAELDLGRAMMKMDSETPFSRWKVQGFCSRVPPVLVLDVEMQSDEPLERRIRLERWGTRAFAHYYEQFVDDPAIRLSATDAGVKDGCAFVAQTLTRRRVATVMKIVTDESASIRVLHDRAAEIRLPRSARSRFRILVSGAATEIEEDAVGQGIEAVGLAESDPHGLLTGHLERWSDFWQRSFIALPEDDYLENLYYFHFYSLFSCALGNFPPNFSGGGWTWNGDVRNWGHLYHWNQQQLLWAAGAAGRPELAESYLAFCARLLPRACRDAGSLFHAEGGYFSDIADANGNQAVEPDTMRDFTVGPQIALAMFDHFLFTGNLGFLKDQCLPVLAACAAFYHSMMRKEEDGRMRISGGSTPYESYWVLKETLTDGCAIRAVLKALGAAEAVLGIPEPSEGSRRDLLDAMPEMPATEAGDRESPLRKVFSAGRKWDGSAVGFEEGKYPLSAFPATLLAPVFPFAVLGLSDAGSGAFSIARDTVRLFLDTNVYRLGAYGASGHTPAPEAAARLGLRDDVLPVLRLFVRRYQRFANGFMHYASSEDGHYDDGRGFFTPRALRGNETETLYSELHVKSRGERRPLDSKRFLHMYYEASSNVAAGIQEMLLQSHEGVVRVFPAFPDSGTAAFALFARGGFLVESEKKDGKIPYIRASAKKGGRLRIELPWREPAAMRREGGGGERIVGAGGTVDIDLAAEESVILFPEHESIDSGYSQPVHRLANTKPKRFENATLGKPRDF